MSKVVEQIGEINFQGNVVPINWFKHIKTDAGKPDAIGVMLLSDIIYWYRPIEIRDEATGQIIGYKKKFKADKLQRSYEQFSELFGFTKSQVKRAIKRLEKAGIITVEFRNITTESGLKLCNVMYIEPVPEKIKEITYSKNKNTSKPHNDGVCSHVSTNLSTPPNKNVHTLPTNLFTPPNKNVHTNTEITTETTTETTSSSSDDGEVFDFYQQNFGTLSPYLAEYLSSLTKDYGKELTIEAMKVAIKNKAQSMNYINAVLQNWHTKGIKTVKDINALERDKNRNKGQDLGQDFRESIYKPLNKDVF